ncbi:MAG: DNA/RNA non-specific endonuclease, partial [Enterococcus sp.]
VADYLKDSSSNYVRYRVTPIFKGNDLLANGVEMEAKSLGSNAVDFNVYIFNVQPGVVLNYKDGTSHVKHGSSTIAEHVRAKRHSTRHVTKVRTIHNIKHKISTANYQVIGNKRSKIYHVASGENYHMSSANAVYFHSEAAARRAGYRKSLR